MPAVGEDEWAIPADWFADTAPPAPDNDGDEPGSGDGGTEGRNP